jgi:hypothetical protein
MILSPSAPHIPALYCRAALRFFLCILHIQTAYFYYSIEPAVRQELPSLPGKKLAKNAVFRRPAAYKQPVRAPQTK